nr:transcription factor glabra 3 [Quercus suber]
MDFVGSNYSGESTDGHHCSYALGVFDEETQSLKIVPVAFDKYMDVINNLHLDAHSVQSSALDGILTLTLKSKFRGAAIALVGMIKQALWKIAFKC